MSANCWTILGIAPTSDRRGIQRAYAKQSQRYHPEDAPEDFQLLQEAYQEALSYRENSLGRDQEIDLTGFSADQHPLRDQLVVSPEPFASEEVVVKDGGGASQEEQGDEGVDVSSQSMPRTSLFQSHAFENQDDKEHFLSLVAQGLSEPLLSENLKPYLDQALRQNYLQDTLFKEELEYLVAALRVDGRAVNLSSLRQLAESYQLLFLERLYRQELVNRGYPLDGPQPQLPKSERQSYTSREQARKDQQRQELVDNLKTPVVRVGIRRLAAALAPLILMLVRCGRVEQAVNQPQVMVPSSVTLVGSETSVTAIGEEVLMGILNQPVIKEDNGHYSYVPGQQLEPIPLPDVVRAYVLPVETQEETAHVAVATRDEVTWFVLDDQGQLATAIVLEAGQTLSAETVLINQDGHYRIK